MLEIKSNELKVALKREHKRHKLNSPPCCMVDGSTFSPADRDTKKPKGITHKQMVKYAST